MSEIGSKKKTKKAEQEDVLPWPTEVEALVVGAGPAGLRAFDAIETGSKLLLEAGPQLGGAATRGLHFAYATPADAESPALPAMRIRWDRAWRASSEVDWGSKEWAFLLPQWKLYLGEGLRTWSSEPISSQERPMQLIRVNCPVNAVEPVSDASRALWRVRTPQGEVMTPRLIWAAGIMAFQNAVGKIAAQRYMDSNPRYTPEAADARGGAGFDLILAEKPEFEKGFNASAPFGIPVRHGGKLYLCLGLVVETLSALEIRTLTHLPDEMLKDSKELLSFQKSVRRTLRMMTANDRLEIKHERWFVSARVGGHALGTPWLLKDSEDASLTFVGEESVGAAAASAGANPLGLHI